MRKHYDLYQNVTKRVPKDHVPLVTLWIQGKEEKGKICILIKYMFAYDELTHPTTAYRAWRYQQQVSLPFVYHVYALLYGSVITNFSPSHVLKTRGERMKGRSKNHRYSLQSILVATINNWARQEWDPTRNTNQDAANLSGGLPGQVKPAAWNRSGLASARWWTSSSKIGVL